VYFSDAGLFSIDMYLANADNGRTIRKLVSSTRDPHLESMQFINSAGAWSADGPLRVRCDRHRPAGAPHREGR